MVRSPVLPATRVLAAALLVTGAPWAQAQLGNDEALVRWVDGRPMLLATLRAEDRVYLCHLLLDLGANDALFLHRNAASVLKSTDCQVELGTIKLADVPFTARRDTWLEALTKDHAEALQQVPVAGILGLSAFAGRDVVIDGPAGLLRLRPPVTGEAPPASGAVTPVPLATEPGKSGVGFVLDLGNGVQATFRLYSREPFSWIDPQLARQVGHADGVLATARVGELDFAQRTPFRPVSPQGGQGGQGGIGGALLRTLVLNLQCTANRIVIEHPTPPRYPEDEAALYRATYGSSDTAPLRAFLAAHGDSPWASTAAATLLERLAGAGQKDLPALQEAGLAAIRAAPAKGKATRALEVLATLPAEAAALRRAIADAGLAEARVDEDGSAAHKLRLELGRLARAEGNLKDARRHLLAAVFGMPISGPANLEMGALHAQQGELEQALGRFFLAILDARNTGQEGFVAFVAALKKLHGDKADVLAALADMADGRVPAFHPLPRDPAAIQKTGRTVLAELFTGAMCPPCAAADVAADGLAELFGADELVLLQWHLPIPAPEPMVAPVSLWRGQSRGIRGTPTLIVAGGETISGGGKAEEAPEQFRRYREVVERELAQAPTATLAGRAALRGDEVAVEVWGGARSGEAGGETGGETGAAWRLHAVLVEELLAFPGSNGILFHHHVARARLTPEEGAPIAGTSAEKPWRGSLALADVERELDEQVTKLESRRAFLVRPVTLDRQRLRVVCFLEGSAGGKVLQALSLPLASEAAR